MIEFERDAQKWLLVVGGIVCFLAAFAILVSFKGSFGPDTARSRNVLASRDKIPEKTVEQNQGEGTADGWIVYVTGAVQRPGVYEVSADSRVNEAVRLAGGFSPQADPEGINLAARLTDGVHVKVPERNADNAHNQSTGERRPRISAAGTPPSSGASGTRSPIDLNRASHAELCTLPGIGAKLAQSIIDHREINGPFGTVEDICQVSGIGEKRLEDLREFVIVIVDQR